MINVGEVWGAHIFPRLWVLPPPLPLSHPPPPTTTTTAPAAATAATVATAAVSCKPAADQRWLTVLEALV